MLQLLKPHSAVSGPPRSSDAESDSQAATTSAAATTAGAANVAVSASGGSGTKPRGDVSYGQTDYFSQKTVMSLNSNSQLGMPYSNGDRAVTAPSYDQQQEPQPQQQHPQQQSTATYQDQFLYSQPPLPSSTVENNLDAPPPIRIEPTPSRPLEQDALKGSHTDTMPVHSPYTNHSDMPPQHPSTQMVNHHHNSQHQGMIQQQSEQEAGLPSKPMLDFNQKGQHVKQNEQSGFMYSSEAAAADSGRKDYPTMRLMVDKQPAVAAPTMLKIPHFGTYTERRPLMRDEHAPGPPTSVPSQSTDHPQPFNHAAVDDQRDGMGDDQEQPQEGRSSADTGDLRKHGQVDEAYMARFMKEESQLRLCSNGVLDKAAPSTDSDVAPQSTSSSSSSMTAAELATKNASSPMRMTGDDPPATHSDSGIVHDGGSNTSSNSGSSGDHDDSAAVLRSHSPETYHYRDGGRSAPPPAEGDGKGAGATLSSAPFLPPNSQTAAGSHTPPGPHEKHETEAKPRRHSSPMPMGFSPSGSMAPGGSRTPGRETPPERRPLHIPPIPHSMASSMGMPPGMASPFMSPGSGMALSPSQRHPLTPTSSTRSASPSDPSSFDNKDVYFCHLCSYVGTSQFHFKQHMDSHFEHRCPHCDYTSRTEGRLKRHIKDFHSEVPPENYSGNRTVRAQAPKPKVYKCKQCEFQSMVKIDFWEHSRTHIKEDKVLQCPKCPFVTEYKHHLEYHLRNHFGSKPFKCPKCNYACVNKSMLNSHMKSHTNVYQYRCADCTYATKYCHSLKLHLKKYNHKPATVLNADGSLPTDGSGDFELVSKRGPPRGPRGPRKERPEPPGPVPPMNPMMGLPQMPPGMNGLPPPGLMPGYWPMMPPMPNGGLHPPPPLIPVSGSPFNPSLSLALQRPPSSQQQQPPPPQQQQQQAMSPLHPYPAPEPHSEAGPPTEPGHPGDVNGDQGGHQHHHHRIKCVLCDFTSDNRPGLNDHMLKVHAKENQDLLNMFGLQPDSLHGDETASRTRVGSAEIYKPEVSETAATPIKQEQPSSHSSGQASPPPANQAWIMNTSQPGARKSTPAGSAFPSPMFRSTPQGPLPAQALDSMQQQAKERYNAVVAAEIASSIESEAKHNGECPLDLTKGKEHMPPHLAVNQMLLNPGFSHMFSQLNKRRFDQISMVAMAAAASASGHLQEGDVDMDGDADASSPPSSMADSGQTPRKRSRKGKAYKLDTICQKLQERYSDSPSPMASVTSTGGPGHDSNDDDTSDSANSAGGPEQMAPGSSGGENDAGEQIDYRAIHSSLSELNRQMAVDSYSGGEGGDGHRDEGKERPTSQPSQPLFSGSMNRRKLYMMRQSETGMSGDDSETNGQRRARSESEVHDLDAQGSLKVERSEEETADSAMSSGMDTSRARASPPPYECTHCGMAFRDCVMYTVHMGYHGYQDPFKCNMCGHVSENRVEFFLHIARAAHE